MSQNRGPVQARSLSGQQSSSTPPPVLDSSYYSTSNPFASAPMQDESGPRQDRYWRDRMGSDERESTNYGGGGMRGRLMTA